MATQQLNLSNEVEVPIDEAAELLEHYTDAGQNVMMSGAPGVGKSAIGFQLGEKKKRPVIEWIASMRETVDVRGVPVADLKTGTTRWLPPDELPRVDRDGEEGYLFLDEITNAPLPMQAVLYGLIQTGRVGEYTLPKGWRIIGAGNRVGDRAAAQKTSSALNNRWAHVTIISEGQRAVAAWCKWALANGVPPELIAFIRFRPELLHKMPTRDEKAFCTPRSITMCSPHIKVANSSLRQKLFAGHIGNAPAGEMSGFVDLYRSLGDLQDIIANPDTARVPNNTERSELYAVATALARLAKRENIKQIVKYADRLPREQRGLLMHEAGVVTPALKQTAAYGKWLVENQDMIMQS